MLFAVQLCRHRGRRRRFPDPVLDRFSSVIGNRVDDSIRPLDLFDGVSAHQSVSCELVQLLINLLLSRAPEETDGLVESLADFVAAMRAIEQGHQNGM